MADRHPAAGHRFGPRYLSVLGSAVLCYAALGAVLRDVPFYVEHRLGGTAFEVGLVVGAPSLAGAILRPVGGRLADRSGPVMVLMGGALVMSVGVVPAFAKNGPPGRRVWSALAQLRVKRVHQTVRRVLVGAGVRAQGRPTGPGWVGHAGDPQVGRGYRRASW